MFFINKLIQITIIFYLFIIEKSQMLQFQNGNKIQMFEYNRQQKKIEGIFSKKKLQKLDYPEDEWKINSDRQNLGPERIKFMKELDFNRTKLNPFLQIQQMNNPQPQLIASLDFSTIQLKSPTYSSSYNSMRNQHFFPPCSNENKKPYGISQMKFNLLKTKQKVHEFPATYQGEVELEVPTFFIKMPEQFREQKKKERKDYSKKTQRDLNQELDDIYNGKFKISWHPNNQKFNQQ